VRTSLIKVRSPAFWSNTAAGALSLLPGLPGPRAGSGTERR
jgi:hypothetical protein